jgi:hypothetical protein
MVSQSTKHVVLLKNIARVAKKSSGGNVVRRTNADKLPAGSPGETAGCAEKPNNSGGMQHRSTQQDRPARSDNNKN